MGQIATSPPPCLSLRVGKGFSKGTEELMLVGVSAASRCRCSLAWAQGMLQSLGNRGRGWCLPSWVLPSMPHTIG